METISEQKNKNKNKKEDEEVEPLLVSSIVFFTSIFQFFITIFVLIQFL